ncbi:MAG: hypothetical protein JWN23_2727 [Rhodocyclales bacterium]|nr:hypothetical protein [Rhodocyclales bacterium]
MHELLVNLARFVAAPILFFLSTLIFGTGGCVVLVSTFGEKFFVVGMVWFFAVGIATFWLLIRIFAPKTMAPPEAPNAEDSST